MLLSKATCIKGCITVFRASSKNSWTQCKTPQHPPVSDWVEYLFWFWVVGSTICFYARSQSIGCLQRFFFRPYGVGGLWGKIRCGNLCPGHKSLMQPFLSQFSFQKVKRYEPWIFLELMQTLKGFICKLWFTASNAEVQRKWQIPVSTWTNPRTDEDWEEGCNHINLKPWVFRLSLRSFM